MRKTGLCGLMLLSIAISGCGGGARPTVFESFSNIDASDTTRMTGDAKVVDYEIDPVTGEVTAGGVTDVEAEVDLTTDDLLAIVAASIKSGSFKSGSFGFFLDSDEVKFALADGDNFADGSALDPLAVGFAIATSAAEDRAAIVGDPTALGFEYQSFGIWATGIDVGSGVAGAASVGSATPVAAVQALIGEATYDGKSTGFYVDSVGTGYVTFADFQAKLDFDNQEIVVLTSDTGVIDILTGASMAMTSLNFVGTGPASVGGPAGGATDGTFQADIISIGLDLTGTMDGRLYGPSGEEIGGLFEMAGDDGFYIGSVGAVD